MPSGRVRSLIAVVVAYGILGPLEVRVDGELVALGGDRRRALLARLLVAHGRAVPVAVLIEDLWSGSPPPRADATLQSHVSGLRRVLGADRIERTGRSYRLRLAGDELDASLAEADLATARSRMQAGDAAGAVGAVEQALARWRGSPLADVAAQPWARAEVARLEELRAQCLETWLEARLATGRPEEVVTRAEAAVAEYPLRERMWSHLIVGLYRSGRQADALRSYQRVRKLLADELGLDPSPQLAMLERAVLGQDAALDGPAASVPADHDPVTSTEDRVREAAEPSAPPGDGPARGRPRRKVLVVASAFLVALVLGGLSWAASFSSQQDAPALPEEMADRPPPSAAPPTTADKGGDTLDPRIVASGTTHNGRPWHLRARIDDLGQICTRFSVTGGATGQETCEVPPTDNPFGIPHARGFRPSEPVFITWFVVSAQTAQVRTTTADGTSSEALTMVTEPALGVRYAVSTVSRMDVVTFTALDASGRQLGQVRLRALPPPPHS